MEKTFKRAPNMSLLTKVLKKTKMMRAAANHNLAKALITKG
jgi:hypothetical protein